MGVLCPACALCQKPLPYVVSPLRFFFLSVSVAEPGALASSLCRTGAGRHGPSGAQDTEAASLLGSLPCRPEKCRAKGQSRGTSGGRGEPGAQGMHTVASRSSYGCLRQLSYGKRLWAFGEGGAGIF